MGASVMDVLSLGDCIDNHNLSDHEEKDVGFNICKNYIFTT